MPLHCMVVEMLLPVFLMGEGVRTDICTAGLLLFFERPGLLLLVTSTNIKHEALNQ